MVEFAISAILLSLILSGAIEFGFIMGHKVELDNAARSGARWAASNSVTSANNSWSSAASPASNTTEGQVLSAGGTSSIPNNDSHISIQYYDNAGASPVLCGHYSATSSSFVAASGYTQASCVDRSNLVTVTVSDAYPLFTRLFAASPTLSASATFEVMN
jgi:Flp pilus assembly protein TadG